MVRTVGTESGEKHQMNLAANLNEIKAGVLL